MHVILLVQHIQFLCVHISISKRVIYYEPIFQQACKDSGFFLTIKHIPLHTQANGSISFPNFFFFFLIPLAHFFIH